MAPCPAERPVRRAADGQLVTQYEFARAGIVTEEMIYVAHRENLGRAAAQAARAGPEAAGHSIRATDKAFDDFAGSAPDEARNRQMLGII